MRAKRFRHFDTGSTVVIVLTLALFLLALFLKGFSHDLLLEAGVFLVSVKLILMAHKSAIIAERTDEHLQQIQAALQRVGETAAEAEGRASRAQSGDEPGAAA